jgi:hypothetical protein
MVRRYVVIEKEDLDAMGYGEAIIVDHSTGAIQALVNIAQRDDESVLDALLRTKAPEWEIYIDYECFMLNAPLRKH